MSPFLLIAILLFIYVFFSNCIESFKQCSVRPEEFNDMVDNEELYQYTYGPIGCMTRGVAPASCSCTRKQLAEGKCPKSCSLNRTREPIQSSACQL
jgi:hypothetical protein